MKPFFSLRFLVLILTPLLFLPVLIWFYHLKEVRCGYLVIVMAIYWTMEPIPTPITALLPVIFLPMLGLASAEKACEPYFTEANMLFLACLMIAIAVENSGLHKRIALRILISGPNQFKYLLLGFMFTSMFLGMWIINTAAISMMLPILDVIIKEIFTNDELADINGHPSAEENIRKLLYLSVAFSATIGGTSTLTSNGPNLVLKVFLEEFYQNIPLDYSVWLLFCMPASILSVILLWFAFNKIFIRNNNRIKRVKAVQNILLQAYKDLGPISFHEISVLILFSLLVILWMLRDPTFIRGWVHLFNDTKPKDATPALIIVILMISIPSHPLSSVSTGSLLDWELIKKKLPWTLILLRGGGFSLAKAVTSSGLSTAIAHHLSYIHNLPIFLILIIFSLLSSFITELATNSATATILLPIAGAMATEIGVHPLKFLIPVTLSCSFAFMLPVGTPANALTASHANISSRYMILPGLISKIICIIIMLTNINIMATPIFRLDL